MQSKNRIKTGKGGTDSLDKASFLSFFLHGTKPSHPSNLAHDRLFFTHPRPHCPPRISRRVSSNCGPTSPSNDPFALPLAGPPRDRSNIVSALPPGEYSTLAYLAIRP